MRFRDSHEVPTSFGSRIGEPSSKIRTSPERSEFNSRKSSAQNSVGSSFSDLSGKKNVLVSLVCVSITNVNLGRTNKCSVLTVDSSVTQSAMEDAYLSGYNNSRM